MSIGDRLSSLSRNELVGLAVVVAVTLGGAGLWYTRSLPKPVAVQATPAAVAASGVVAVAGSPSPSPVPLFVDVAGWVRRPGVYEFATGQRVIDAIDAAGGARSSADLAALNLAAPLTDGTQILVPKAGAAPAGTVTTIPGAGGSVDGALVNINTASATELEALDGIGEVIAAAIVDYRTQNGPFTSVDQLEDVSGIGPATMQGIRDSVTV
jgi:competence protein ComEA